MTHPGFAVFDFETTGFSNSDRVIEAAFVLVDKHGNVQDSWQTLVNPFRNPGATEIHGITAPMLAGAPTFKQIAPRIIETVRGRALVGHNATFDARFLHNEMNRIGINMTGRPPVLCTQKYGNRVLGVKKLALCCAATNIVLDDAHEALADTMATAELMLHLRSQVGPSKDWRKDFAASSKFVWPNLTPIEFTPHLRPLGVS